MPYGTKELKIIGCAKPQPFEITSGKMIVTDPCYDKQTWCQAKLDDVRNGTWYATAEYSDEDDWGDRVAQIWAWHDSLGIDNPGRDFPTCSEFIPYDIGVDSGQAGFFDLDKYPDDTHKDDAFYDAVCKLTLSRIPFSVLEEVGVYPMADLSKLSDEQKANRTSSNYHERKLYYMRQFTGKNGEDNRPNTDKSKMADALALHGSLGLFGVLPFGAVSSSGFGDGSYNLYVERDSDGEVVAARIEFIVEDPENDEDE